MVLEWFLEKLKISLAGTRLVSWTKEKWLTYYLWISFKFFKATGNRLFHINFHIELYPFVKLGFSFRFFVRKNLVSVVRIKVFCCKMPPFVANYSFKGSNPRSKVKGIVLNGTTKIWKKFKFVFLDPVDLKF